MEYKRLGRSGLNVSRIILGCMGFGDPSRGTHEWALGIDEARPIIKQALEAGITTFDTANLYSFGASEEIVGTVLGELTRRDDVMIATKVFSRMGPGPKDAGLSRAAIFAQVEQSLKRLKTDYIDLYQIHRYDPNTPIEETLEALHDLVKSGKVRYIGASSMYAWQFAQAQYVADLHGWTRFVSMQDQYNLLMREEEREMLPFCLPRLAQRVRLPVIDTAGEVPSSTPLRLNKAKASSEPRREHAETGALINKRLCVCSRASTLLAEDKGPRRLHPDANG
jgi:aryl-alcohol dehydrogenase-like predicted oxidoreductase